MNEETARDLRERTLKVLEERVDRVAETLRATEGTAVESIARKIADALEGDAVMEFTFTRSSKTLIVNGVRESPSSARLSGGEGNPTPALVLPLTGSRASSGTKNVQLTSGE